LELGVTEPLRNCWSESDQKAVREQLDRILKSGPFHQSQRRQRFLEYIVNETLAGRGERLKGYNVALEVFDRPKTFDPLVDPVVRIEAARLRDRLREYYEADGQKDPVSIGLPKGTYTPQIDFRRRGTADPSAALLADPPILESPAPKRRMPWQIAAPALALILVLGSIGAWQYRALWVTAPGGTAEDLGIDLAQGPAIAVLPFVNLSGDSEQEYFSDGLTEDIMTELSRVRDLRVLARNTTFQYKGQSVDVSKLGRDLRVRYVLEGSVQRADDRLRVTAQLIDTGIGTHIWADRFDREMADVFLVQDEIVSEIVAKIAGGYGVIENTETNAATRKSPEEIQAYDLVLRAREAMAWEWSRATFRLASESLRQAIVLDPASARARREYAWLAVIGRAFRFDETPLPPAQITAEATKAVRLDPANARARMVAASAYFFNEQLDLFEHEAQQAMALGAYDPEILATLGYMIAISGQWQRGVELVGKANALNAFAAAGWYHVTMYLDHYMKGDYERALEVIRQAPGRQSPYLYIGYIPICGQLGHKQEALQNWRKLLEEEPGWSAESFENWYRVRNMRDEDIAKLMDGVRKSGVLEADARPGQ
jgi:TolB-like protein/tetratricopeptide (TPR) repeat protein